MYESRIELTTTEILDTECVLCHLTGLQNKNENALINPPCWICLRSIDAKADGAS